MLGEGMADCTCSVDGGQSLGTLQMKQPSVVGLMNGIQMKMLLWETQKQWRKTVKMG